MIEAQVVSIESERLAEAFHQEILVKATLIAASEGEIELAAFREEGEFGRIILSSSTSSARRAPLLTAAQVRRLAMDVRAKVLARAASLDGAARKVVVTIHPRRVVFEIEVTISYR